MLRFYGPLEQKSIKKEGVDETRYVPEYVLQLRKLKDSISPLKILNEIMIPAMKEDGERYSRTDIFLPEMVASAVTVQIGIKALEPLLLKQGYESKGKLAIGTVEGDFHDIGKNIVIIMLKGAGYEVVDLGVDSVSAMYCLLQAFLSLAENSGHGSINFSSGPGIRKSLKVEIGVFHIWLKDKNNKICEFFLSFFLPALSGI